ncbi:MAG: DUF2065 domain-containing protein [Deltaproteobacteria bacterium]|nr:DUF2065 domain-containing protein [Deltaproteobacteria bacterium]
MSFNLSIFLCGLGLALILEGLPYFLWAEKMPVILRTMAEQPPGRLRILGLCAILSGLAVVFMGRSLH